MGKFAVLLLGKADRAGDDARPDIFGHGAHDRRRVDPPAQERADWYVASKLDANRFAQVIAQDCFVEPIFLSFGREWDVPVFLDCDALFGAQKEMCSRELLHLIEDGGGRRNVEETEVLV